MFRASFVKIKRMKDKKLPKIVSYEVCVKKHGTIYVIGKFYVFVYKGELMFIPDAKFFGKDPKFLSGEIEHIMWHASGRYHIKKKGVNDEDRYDVHQDRKGSVPFKESGFQPLLNLYIEDVTKLRSKHMADKLDVVIDIKETDGSICLEISTLSGRWMLENRPEIGFGFIVSTHLLPNLVGKERRAVGPQSDNADKIIQFSISGAEFPVEHTDHNVIIKLFKNSGIQR